MAKFNTNLADSEFDGKKIADQGNPLNGTVEENKAKFDAYPHAILMKLRAIVGELEEMFKNKDLSANDFTTELKEKLEGLENYDDGELKDLIKNSVTELKGKHNEDVIMLENSIKQKIADLVGQAPETLDTLHEIAEAFTENQNIVSGILETIEQKASKALVDAIEISVQLLNKRKVEKEDGKGLSTNDYTDEEKEKVDANAKKINNMKSYVDEQIGLALEGDY